MTTLHLLAGIAFDPTIRGLLVVGVGVVVLMGSIYLILGTNVGTRLGFMLSAAGLFGWLFLLGLIWWMYGIGMKGQDPHWKVVEVNVGHLDQAALEDARALNLETLETVTPDTLNDAEGDEYAKLRDRIDPTLGHGWKLLPASDPARGEAQATVDEFLKEAELPGVQLPDTDDNGKPITHPIEDSSDYLPLYGFEKGGKPQNKEGADMLSRIQNKIGNTVRILNPPRYAIIQVQPVIQAKEVPGEAPPPPTVDEDQPVISVIMERNLGDRRFPAAMITIGSGSIFALLCYLLHLRDKRVSEHLAIASTSGS